VLGLGAILNLSVYTQICIANTLSRYSGALGWQALLQLLAYRMALSELQICLPEVLDF